MKTALLALVLASAALLGGCGLLDPGPEPAAFSSVTLTATPLPADEDGSGPDLYVEIQDVGGRAVAAGDVIEDAAPDSLPAVVIGSGALVGTARSYFVVVMDLDDDGYDLIGVSQSFTAEDLRAAESDVFEVANTGRTIRARIALN